MKQPLPSGNGSKTGRKPVLFSGGSDGKSCGGWTQRQFANGWLRLKTPLRSHPSFSTRTHFGPHRAAGLVQRISAVIKLLEEADSVQRSARSKGGVSASLEGWRYSVGGNPVSLVISISASALRSGARESIVQGDRELVGQFPG